MPADIFSIFVNDSKTAVGISLIALIISLYALYREHTRTGKRSRGRKKKISFLLPSHTRVLLKDAFTAFAIILVLGSLFFFSAYGSELKLKKYIGTGIQYIQKNFSNAHEKAPVAAAVSVSSAPETPLLLEAIARAKEEREREEQEQKEKEEQEKKEIQRKKLLSSKPKETPPAPPPSPAPSEQKEPAVLVPSEADGPAPDIVPSVLSHYGGALTVGSLLSFSVIVSNNGEEHAAASFTMQLKIDEGNNGTFDFSFAKIATPPLEKGQTEAKIWKSAWVGKAGMHKAEACADVDNAILEINEKNNCISYVFAVAGKEIKGDLTVSNLKIIPATPSESQNVAFSVRILNSGSERSGGGYAHLSIDGALPSKKYVASLSPGAYEDISWGTIWKAIRGPHTYTVCADGGNDVFESNEENNCISGALDVIE